jgi:hypothetical protein
MPMEAIERVAYLSVGRACGFAGLAIVCFMIGLSFDPHLAARAGGVFSLVMTGVLLLMAATAPTRPYKRTETWLMLSETERPAAHIAQEAIGSILREVYLWYARSAALVAVVLMIAAVILSVIALR